MMDLKAKSSTLGIEFPELKKLDTVRLIPAWLKKLQNLIVKQAVPSV